MRCVYAIELQSGAFASVAELLREPSIDGIGELKRAWTYGFCVRCCEDALRASG